MNKKSELKYKDILENKEKLYEEIKILKLFQYEEKLTKEQGEIIQKKIKSKIFQYNYYTYLLRNYEDIK